MKIEKVNDNQIRCIITPEDLENRKLNISEFTSGTSNVRKLLKDMMQKAEAEFGFKTDNSPLMIEAMPISDKSVMILVTKGDEAKKKISQGQQFQGERVPADSNYPELKLEKLNGLEAVDPEDRNSLEEQDTKIFIFARLEDIITVSKIIADKYTGYSKLFKDTRHGYVEYILLLNRADMQFNDFNRSCNTIIEFAEQIPSSQKLIVSYLEHCEVMIEESAISKLASI